MENNARYEEEGRNSDKDEEDMNSGGGIQEGRKKITVACIHSDNDVPPDITCQIRGPRAQDGSTNHDKDLGEEENKNLDEEEEEKEKRETKMTVLLMTQWMLMKLIGMNQ